MTVAAASELVLARPDDWHVHFRDGETLASTVPPIARVFGRVVAMPNLAPPVVTVEAALAYAARLRAAAGAHRHFEPLVSLYLTEATPPEAIAAAKAEGLIAVKWYPAGATTHAEAGVADIGRVDDVLAAMAETGLVLQVHGEVTDPDVDVFDREATFVERTLAPLVARHPTLPVVLEHVTSRAGVDFVRAARDGVAATITAHHLLIDRNDLFLGPEGPGLRPHCYCLPVAKTRADRLALVAAATSGEPRFFLGSDSAPHPRARKESARAPAGIYTGHAVLELYAEVFEAAGALDRLEAFAAHHGADFYRLPRARERVVLRREPWVVPAELPLGSGTVVPLRAGGSIAWRVDDTSGSSSG